MRPYKNRKLEEYPDVGDIKEEGRKSRVGKLASKSGEYKSYTRNPASRKATRRHLKRQDKARTKRLEEKDV